MSLSSSRSGRSEDVNPDYNIYILGENIIGSILRGHPYRTAPKFDPILQCRHILAFYRHKLTVASTSGRHKLTVASTSGRRYVYWRLLCELLIQINTDLQILIYNNSRNMPEFKLTDCVI